MKRILTLAIISIAMLFADNLKAQPIGVVRGPYLQMGTPTSITIRWRSVNTEAGQITYGTDYNNLNTTVVDTSAPTNNHEFTLTGLTPDTKYFYKVGKVGSNYAGQDSTYYFKTSPLPGTQQPIRIWAIGDFGNGSPQQAEVKDAYLDHIDGEHTDMWVWLGDNAYGDGTDQEYQVNNFEVYTEVFPNHVIWPCPGNHDYKSVDAFTNDGPYYEIFTLPTNGEAGGVPSGEEGYYSWDYGNVHIISLNSENLLWTITAQTAMGEWLKEDLDSTDADWIIAFWHQPPYTKSTHDSDDDFSRHEMMRAAYNPLLEQYGVDLVLGGHSHGYERSFLIKGHFGKSNTFNPATMLVDSSNGDPSTGGAYVKQRYGNNPNEGTVYSVVGCSGQKGSGSHPLNHPAMYISTEEYWGGMIIDIDGKVLDARFLTKDGDIQDEFRIIKKDSANDVTNIIEVNNNSLPPLRVYPNPSSGVFTAEYVIDEPGRYTMTLVGNDGRLLRTFFDEKKRPGNYAVSYDIATDGLAAGWYHIMLKDQKNRTRTQQIIRVE